MPGHVKRGGTGEPDPDPAPYLFVSYEDKQKDLAKVCTVFTVNNYCTALSNSSFQNKKYQTPYKKSE